MRGAQRACCREQLQLRQPPPPPRLRLSYVSNEAFAPEMGSTMSNSSAARHTSRFLAPPLLALLAHSTLAPARQLESPDSGRSRSCCWCWSCCCIVKWRAFERSKAECNSSGGAQDAARTVAASGVSLLAVPARQAAPAGAPPATRLAAACLPTPERPIMQRSVAGVTSVYIRNAAPRVRVQLLVFAHSLAQMPAQCMPRPVHADKLL